MTELGAEGWHAPPSERADGLLRFLWHPAPAPVRPVLPAVLLRERVCVEEDLPEPEVRVVEVGVEHLAVEPLRHLAGSDEASPREILVDLPAADGLVDSIRDRTRAP